MSVLPELGAWLVSDTTLFRLPSSTGSKTIVWLGRFAAEQPDTAVHLMEYAGGPPRRNYSGVDHERIRIQVVSRSTSYATARANAQAVWDSLDTVGNSTLSGTRYISVEHLQSPFFLNHDAEDRVLFAFNTEAVKEKS